MSVRMAYEPYQLMRRQSVYRPSLKLDSLAYTDIVRHAVLGWETAQREVGQRVDMIIVSSLTGLVAFW